MTEPKSEAMDGNKVSIEFYGLTNEQVVKIKQVFDTLKPDASFIPAHPGASITAEEWNAFVKQFPPKRIHDPRRARPI